MPASFLADSSAISMLYRELGTYNTTRQHSAFRWDLRERMELAPVWVACVYEGNNYITCMAKSLKQVGGSIPMCLPDFNALVDMLVASVSNLSVLVNNWLDDSSYCMTQEKGGHAGLHRWRCHCADFTTQATQFGCTRFFSSRHMSGSRDMFRIRRNRPIGRGGDIVATKMCLKTLMACA